MLSIFYCWLRKCICIIIIWLEELCLEIISTVTSIRYLIFPKNLKIFTFFKLKTSVIDSREKPFAASLTAIQIKWQQTYQTCIFTFWIYNSKNKYRYERSAVYDFTFAKYPVNASISTPVCCFSFFSSSSLARVNSEHKYIDLLDRS